MSTAIMCIHEGGSCLGVYRVSCVRSSLTYCSYAMDDMSACADRNGCKSCTQAPAITNAHVLHCISMATAAICFLPYVFGIREAQTLLAKPTMSTCHPTPSNLQVASEILMHLFCIPSWASGGGSEISDELRLVSRCCFHLTMRI